MPAPKTEISEIVTALGMTDAVSIEAGLSAPPAAFANISTTVWERLFESYRTGKHADVFASAWANGRAFLAAADGLRGRHPARIEWREAFQAFYESVRELTAIPGLPVHVSALTGAQRDQLRGALSGSKAWPGPLHPRYVEFAHEVARASAARWSMELGSRSAREEQLWRLLRCASAPYFVLGASAIDPMRLRIATPWDWRQAFEFRGLDVTADLKAAQPQVRWAGHARRRADGADVVVEGYVEIRWSHGRFRQPPEAKVQLKTLHEDVPGYFALE